MSEKVNEKLNSKVADSQKLLFEIIEKVALYNLDFYRCFDVDIKLINHAEVF